jgi:hypothetical protein
MRVVVAHDADGFIASLVVCPADGPPVTPGIQLGQYVTALDAPEEMVEFLLQESEGTEQRITEGLKALRVETQAKLVRRRAEDSPS